MKNGRKLDLNEQAEVKKAGMTLFSAQEVESGRLLAFGTQKDGKYVCIVFTPVL
jgi:hypothetical protein